MKTQNLKNSNLKTAVAQLLFASSMALASGITLCSPVAFAKDKSKDPSKEAPKEVTQDAKKGIAAINLKKVQAGNYTIDPVHSKVGFEIPHLVISTVEGQFKQFSGEVTLAEKLADSKVTATVSINSIDTANSDRDAHLKSADFFDTTQFPDMKFVSRKLSGSYEQFKMIGDLTIKGVTKEVTFNGQFLGTVGDAYGNTKAAFKVQTEINRKDFGLTWNKLVEAGPAVGDKVTIKLNIQTAKAK